MRHILAGRRTRAQAPEISFSCNVLKGAASYYYTPFCVRANKIVKYAQGLAKTIYYLPYGNLNNLGKLVRNDFFLRPATVFKGGKGKKKK